MTYPDMVREQLDQAIEQALKNSFAAPKTPTRASKATREDIIKALIFMQGGSLQKELYEMGLDISAPAFVQRRNQLNSALFVDILTALNEQNIDAETYCGYQILAIDGTAVNMARDSKSPSFVCHASAPEGYNQMHANPLYDVLNKTYLDCVIQPQPRQDEIGALLFLLAWHDFERKTLIVADRGYSSYNLFATFQNTRNVDFLIRIKQGRGAMREVAKLPMRELDQEISFTVTTTQTKADKENGYIFVQTRKNKDKAYSDNTRDGRWDFPSPYPMKLRIVRILLSTGEYETLATSLPPSFTPDMIRELYHARWGIETAFRELKYTYGLVNLHGRKDEFVRQEIYAHMIMATLCSRIINAVIVQQSERRKYVYRVNQKMAIFLCKQFFRTPGADGGQLMRDIEKYVVPIRPGRSDMRNLQAKGFVGFVYRVAA